MASLDELRSLERRWAMPTYSRLPVAFVRGEGMRLWDTEGKEYLDFLSGIGVCNVGHCHPAVVEAVRKQVGELIHCSNWAYTEPAPRLAERLACSSLQGKVFLSNSGAEANECAIKLARKHAKGRRKGDATGGSIIVSEGGFHGRTLGTLSATPQPEKQEPFAPLIEGFVAVPRNDPDALTAVFDDDTQAVILEPVQGESGVHVLDADFLQAARSACDRYGALLIFDEVQCGLGRTGSLWAYQQTGVKPDLIVSAKALAAGLPIGATITRPEFGDVLAPGDHGSTFGGGPLVAAAAETVLEILEDGELLRHVLEVGNRFLGELLNLVSDGKAVEARGRGLMLAMDLERDGEAGEVVNDALAEGLLINATGPRTVRFLPPLIVDWAEIEILLDFLKERLVA